MTVTAIQIGLHPDAVDFESADFSQFKGLTKEGLTKANSDNVAGLRAAGYEVDTCLIATGDAGAEKARTWLATKSYDAVLIGAGVRLVAANTLLFEAIVNAAHAFNPVCRFVFNYSATSTPDDIRRWYPNPADATRRCDHDRLPQHGRPHRRCRTAGLTAAGDLARCGRSVAVLERWPEMNPSSRAFATMARTLEVLDARGLVDDVLAHAHRAPGVCIFAGARIDLTHLRSAYPFVAVTPQTTSKGARGIRRQRGRGHPPGF